MVNLPSAAETRAKAGYMDPSERLLKRIKTELENVRPGQSELDIYCQFSGFKLLTRKEVKKIRNILVDLGYVVKIDWRWVLGPFSTKYTQLRIRW